MQQIGKRRVFFCLLLIAAAIVLKLLLPDPGARLGGWISGMEDPAVARAVEVFCERLSRGSSISEAAEVFHEELP